MARFSQGDDPSNLGEDGFQNFPRRHLRFNHFQTLPIEAAFEHIENIDAEAIMAHFTFGFYSPLNLHALSKAQIEEISPDVMSELPSLGFAISNDYSSISNPYGVPADSGSLQSG